MRCFYKLISSDMVALFLFFGWDLDNLIGFFCHDIQVIIKHYPSMDM